MKAVWKNEMKIKVQSSSKRTVRPKQARRTWTLRLCYPRPL